MDITGAYLNACMSSIVVYIYFEPVCAANAGVQEVLMKDDRMVVKLDKLLFG